MHNRQKSSSLQIAFVVEHEIYTNWELKKMTRTIGSGPAIRVFFATPSALTLVSYLIIYVNGGSRAVKRTEMFDKNTVIVSSYLLIGIILINNTTVRRGHLVMRSIYITHIEAKRLVALLTCMCMHVHIYVTLSAFELYVWFQTSYIRPFFFISDLFCSRIQDTCIALYKRKCESLSIPWRMISSHFYKYLYTLMTRANHDPAALLCFSKFGQIPARAHTAVRGQKKKKKWEDYASSHKPRQSSKCGFTTSPLGCKIILLLFGLSGFHLFRYIAVFIRYFFEQNNSPRYDGIRRLACNP